MKLFDIGLRGRTVIESLLKADFEILEIDFSDSSALFICNTFEKDSSNSIGSTNYISFEGLEITDVFENSTINSNLESLKSSIRKRIEERNFQDYEFSSNHTWRFYKSS
jgi:hypothetical protein